MLSESLCDADYGTETPKSTINLTRAAEADVRAVETQLPLYKIYRGKARKKESAEQKQEHQRAAAKGPRSKQWDGVTTLQDWHVYPVWEPQDLACAVPALGPDGVDLYLHLDTTLHLHTMDTLPISLNMNVYYLKGDVNGEQVIKVEAPTPCIAMSKRQKLDEGNTSNQARKAGKDLKKDNAVAGSAQGSKPEIELMWAKMTSVQQQVSQLTNRVGKIEPTMENVVEVVEGIKGTLQSSLNEANLAKIMKDVIQQVRVEEEDIANTRKKCQLKEVTEVRSNSGHFDGLIQSKLKRFKNLNAGKQALWKESNLGGSEASVSPPDKEKNNNGKSMGSLPIKLRKVPPAKFRRSLFRNTEDGETLIKDLKKVPAMKGGKSAGPYTSKFPVSQDDACIAEYIFYRRNRTNSDHNEVVCSCGGSFTTRTDMQCLRPNGHNKACRGMEEHKTTEDWIQHTASLAGMSRFYGKLGQCDTISVPMHEPTSKSKPNTGHWYLLRIHVKDRYVELVDSLEDETKLISRRHDAKRTMNMLDAILGEDIVNLLDGICSFASLPWYYTTPIRQPNTADCGVFVLRNMEDPTSKWAQKYDSHSERLRLLLDCLRHEKNEISDIHSKVQQSLLSWKGGKKQPKQVSKANDSKAAPFVVNLISGDT
ncbi:hypothetical protein ACLB2K_030693 [Fragaria x ananassa]